MNTIWLQSAFRLAVAAGISLLLWPAAGAAIALGFFAALLFFMLLHQLRHLRDGCLVALLVVGPSLLRDHDVVLLAALRASRQQDYETVSIPAEIDSVSRPKVDPYS